MGGTRIKMKTILFILLTFLLIIFGFVIGYKYGRNNCEIYASNTYTLNEDMFILNDELISIGVLPKGIVLYAIPDPWGDKSMLFKVYLRVDTGDSYPICNFKPRQELKDFQLIEFYLKSKKWKSVQGLNTK